MFYSTCLSVLDCKVNLVPMLLEILEEFQLIITMSACKLRLLLPKWELQHKHIKRMLTSMGQNTGSINHIHRPFLYTALFQKAWWDSLLHFFFNFLLKEWDSWFFPQPTHQSSPGMSLYTLPILQFLLLLLLLVFLHFLWIIYAILFYLYHN